MSETETDQEENKKQLRTAIPDNIRILKSMEALLRKQSKMLKHLWTRPTFTEMLQALTKTFHLRQNPKSLTFQVLPVSTRKRVKNGAHRQTWVIVNHVSVFDGVESWLCLCVINE